MLQLSKDELHRQVLSTEKSHTILEVLSNGTLKVTKKPSNVVQSDNRKDSLVLLELVKNVLDEKLFIIDVFIEKD